MILSTGIHADKPRGCVKGSSAKNVRIKKKVRFASPLVQPTAPVRVPVQQEDHTVAQAVQNSLISRHEEREREKLEQQMVEHAVAQSLTEDTGVTKTVTKQRITVTNQSSRPASLQDRVKAKMAQARVWFSNKWQDTKVMCHVAKDEVQEGLPKAWLKTKEGWNTFWTKLIARIKGTSTQI
jgi:hypothetical protein